MKKYEFTVLVNDIDGNVFTTIEATTDSDAKELFIQKLKDQGFESVYTSNDMVTAVCWSNDEGQIFPTKQGNANTWGPVSFYIVDSEYYAQYQD